MSTCHQLKRSSVELEEGWKGNTPVVRQVVPSYGPYETILLGSELILDVTLPCFVLRFLIYRKSDKFFPSSKACCENLGSIVYLGMMRMEVE